MNSNNEVKLTSEICFFKVANSLNDSLHIIVKYLILISLPWASSYSSGSNKKRKRRLDRASELAHYEARLFARNPHLEPSLC